MVHRSHISSKEAKSRGWSRVPSPAIQRETRKQEVGIDYMKGDYVTFTNCCAVGDNTGGGLTLTAGDSTSWTTSGTASDFTIGGNYEPYHIWTSDWADSSDVTICPQPITIVREIIKEKGVTQMEQRTLFKVYVVDPRKNGKILLDGRLVIAVNENQAMLKAGVADIADAAGLDLEQVDVYVDVIGTFIRPRKETQRVKMVKEEEE